VKKYFVTFLGLLLILLPSNLGKHIILPSSFVLGNLVDYLVPTVYLTDFFVIFLVALMLVFIARQSLPRLPANIKLLVAILLILFLFITLSVLFHPTLPGIYKYLRIALYLAMSILVALMSFSRLSLTKLLNFLSVSILLQCLLACWQFLSQRSLCGFLCLGESTLSPLPYGIARDYFGGRYLISPYGTFPHPNVLGGFLAISLPVLLYFFFALRKRRYLLILYLSLAVLLLTKSQAALLVGVLGLGAVLIYSFKPLGFTSNPSLFSGLFFHISWLSSISFWRRLQLADVSLKMALDQPWFGVGLNQFIPSLVSYGYSAGWPLFLQPVHNIYLLIAAESGIPTLTTFLIFSGCFLLFLFKSQQYLLLLAALQLLLLGLWDHYLWTTPQGLLMLWLTLGIGLSRIRTANAIP